MRWLFLLLILSTPLFAAVPQLVTLFGYVENQPGAFILQGANNLTFNIYQNSTGGSTLYTATQRLLIKYDFSYWAVLDISNVSLNFSNPLFVGVSVNGRPELPHRINLTTVAYSQISGLTLDPSKAGIGICPFGTVVQNTTTSGVECITSSGSGTVVSVVGGYGLNYTNITVSGTLNVNDSVIQNRVVGTCQYGVANISQNGSVVCAAQQSGSSANATANGVANQIGYFSNSTNLIGNSNLTFNVSDLNVSSNIYFTRYNCSSGFVLTTDASGLLMCIQNNNGTVTSVTTGYGLNSTTITTSGTINVNDSTIQNRVAGTCQYGVANVSQNGSVNCATQQGTVTSVVAGYGLNLTTITTTGTLDVNDSVIQNRLSGTCQFGIANVSQNGTVNCASQQTTNNGNTTSSGIANQIGYFTNSTNLISSPNLTFNGLVLNVSSNIYLSQYNCSSGYVLTSDSSGLVFCVLNNNGTVTSVVAGYGLNSTTITSTGTLNVNDSVVQNRLAGTCPFGIANVSQNGTVNCASQQSTGTGNATANGVANQMAYFTNSTNLVSNSNFTFNGASTNISSSLYLSIYNCTQGYFLTTDPIGLLECVQNNNGTVTSVTAGYGLNATTITSSGTLNVNDSVIQNRLSGTCQFGIANVSQNGTVNCATQQGTGNTSSSGSTNQIAYFINGSNLNSNSNLTFNVTDINISSNIYFSKYNCTSGYFLTTDATGLLKCVLNNNGTVTSVTGGDGLTGGAITTSGTLAIDNSSVVRRNAGGNISNANISCSNILGSTSNLCTIVDTTYTNGTGLNLTGTTFSIKVCANAQVLSYNTTALDWQCSSVGSGTVTSITFGDGLSGGVITTTGTVIIDNTTVVRRNSTGGILNGNLPFANVTGFPSSTPTCAAGTVVQNASLSSAGVLTLTCLNSSLPIVQIFTANGTWTKPNNATFVCVYLIGGGGGGAGGEGAANSTLRVGGSGGGGGARIYTCYPAAELPSTVTITIGGGGIAGSGGVAAAGGNGWNGTNTTFGNISIAGAGGGGRGASAGTTSGGGGGGSWGDGAVGGGAAASLGGVPASVAGADGISGQGAGGGNGVAGSSSEEGGASGGGATANAGTAGGSSLKGCPGGGSGGTETTGNVVGNGGNGGGLNSYIPSGGASGGVGAIAAGSAGTNSTYGCGLGGGGSASGNATSTTAVAGGRGGNYGAGGGGGGGAIVGGVGGIGAPGLAVVEAW